MKRALAWAWLILLATAPIGLAGDLESRPLVVGESLPELILEDQHGAQRVVDTSVRVILFSRDMDGGKLLKTGLAELPKGALDAAGAVYISDISEMPRLIASMFALPRMRKRPYAMLLDRTGESTALLPDMSGRGTLIHLEALRITAIEHLDSAGAVSDRIVYLADGGEEEP